MDEGYKIVRFDIYCKTCKHKDKKETEEPCYDCLEYPTNAGTSVPVNWKENE